MDVWRHEGARRKRRVPGKAVLGAVLGYIGLAEDVPGDALDALIGAGDTGDFVLHGCVPSLCLSCPACSPWRNDRRSSRTLFARSRSGTCRPDALRPWSD